MKRHPYLQFLCRCLFLPCFNLILLILNSIGIGTLNSDSGFLSSDNLLINMVFLAVDCLFLTLEFLDAFGILNFIFFGMIVNQKSSKNLGFQAVMFSAIVISFFSYFILCIPAFEPHIDWVISSTKVSFLFSVVPTVIVIGIKYAIWKVQDKHQD